MRGACSYGADSFDLTIDVPKASPNTVAPFGTVVIDIPGASATVGRGIWSVTFDRTRIGTGTFDQAFNWAITDGANITSSSSLYGFYSSWPCTLIGNSSSSPSLANIYGPGDNPSNGNGNACHHTFTFDMGCVRCPPALVQLWVEAASAIGGSETAYEFSVHCVGTRIG